jgi:hypothetical protein
MIAARIRSKKTVFATWRLAVHFLAMLATLVLLLAQTPIDPTLPESLRPVVEAAVQAELDPSRGPANGVALLEEAKSAPDRSARDRLALDLRIAAMKLRQVFLTESQVSDPLRAQQALTTFSRLQLDEPGLAPWVARTLDANPEVRAAFETSPLRLAVLSRGSVRNRKAVERRLVDKLRRGGLRVEIVPPDEARYRVVFGAENTTVADQAAIKGRFVARRFEDGKSTWKREITNTHVGTTPDRARAGALRWLIEVGGRDLAFHHLSELGMPMMVKGPMAFGTAPGLPHSDGHGH